MYQVVSYLSFRIDIAPLTVCVARRTSMAKRSKSIVNRLLRSAHGTIADLTPCVWGTPRRGARGQTELS